MQEFLFNNVIPVECVPHVVETFLDKIAKLVIEIGWSLGLMIC